MDILYLPGNSPSNRVWIESISSSMSSNFDNSYVINYSHWNSEKNYLDFTYELDRLRNLNLFNKDVFVFAKSAGVLLACLAYSKSLINPKKCVFVGSAINYGCRILPNIKTIFKQFEVDSLFIQNELDPAISYSDLDLFLKENFGGMYIIKKFKGSDHKYLQIENLVDLSVKFFVE